MQKTKLASQRKPKARPPTRPAGKNVEKNSPENQQITIQREQTSNTLVLGLAYNGDSSAAWKAFQANEHTTRYPELGRWLYLARSEKGAKEKLSDLSIFASFGAVANSQIVAAYYEEESRAYTETENLKEKKLRENERIAQIQSEKRTVQWLEQRAAKGSDSAQFELGSRYLDGRGVARDAEKARQLLRMSGDQGNKDAITKLRGMGAKEPR